MGAYRVLTKNNVHSRLMDMGFSQLGYRNYTNKEKSLLIKPLKNKEFPTGTFVLIKKTEIIYQNKSLIEIENFVRNLLNE